jgi:hypothetical protein
MDLISITMGYLLIGSLILIWFSLIVHFIITPMILYGFAKNGDRGFSGMVESMIPTFMSDEFPAVKLSGSHQTLGILFSMSLVKLFASLQFVRRIWVIVC